jgi:hypothetical protein
MHISLSDIDLSKKLILPSHHNQQEQVLGDKKLYPESLVSTVWQPRQLYSERVGVLSEKRATKQKEV